MLTATYLSGSIMDMANAAYQSAAAAATTASSPSPSTTTRPSSITDPVADVLDIAKTAAEAEKRKATWLLVGVGLGALVLGVLVGRYAVPKKRK